MSLSNLNKGIAFLTLLFRILPIARNTILEINYLLFQPLF
jgi:hypothetical protein